MPIRIYNSLTRKKDEFKPLEPGKITMYTCGPTVYDDPHIGHARSAYVFDIIRRYLEYRFQPDGYIVRFVRNVTDVDDKIIDKARREDIGGDLNTAVKNVSRKYLDAYHAALRQLNIGSEAKELLEPKASEYIAEMIVFIELLISRGAAYASDGDVYFDITKAGDYGKLSGQSLEKMEAGVRISPSERKKNPLDFALWKKAKPEEPSWPSPWGNGRPGWHIECSVMSWRLLGDEFDIHGGGLDLIFPHHENEIAQTEGAGKRSARYWIHHGLLTINGQKMSKSLGNFITVADFLKEQDGDVLKLFFLATHYSHPVDYTADKIMEAVKQKQTFTHFFDVVNTSFSPDDRPRPELSDKDKSRIDQMVARFYEAMDDDFSTARALACMFELTDFASAREAAFDYAKTRVEEEFRILGLSLQTGLVMPAKVKQLLIERSQAKKNKDFVAADARRKEVADMGFEVLDTGTRVSISTINPKSQAPSAK
jgi:cysteinyl-tRNA synthetase